MKDVSLRTSSVCPASLDQGPVRRRLRTAARVLLLLLIGAVAVDAQTSKSQSGAPSTASTGTSTSQPTTGSAQTLKIIKAVWTARGKADHDITAAVASRVKGNCLDMKADAADLGVVLRPPKRAGTLTITYSLGAEQKIERFREGQDVWIAPLTKEEIEAAPKLVELRRKQPEGLLVLNAKYGEGAQWLDVTDMLRGAVSDDSLTVPVGEEAFGDPARGRAGKRLKLIYAVANEIKSVEIPEHKTLQIGPRRTAIAAIKGGLISFDQKAAELRKAHPSGLLILDARYGAGKRWNDVTEKLQSLVVGDDLSVPVGAGAFDDPVSGHSGKRLVATYLDGQKVVTVETPSGSTLRIGSSITSVVSVSGQLINLQERLQSLRKSRPDGLLILDAQYGAGMHWKDVTDMLQAVVSGESLSVPVGTAALGDPAPGQAGKRLKLVYAQASEIKSVEEYDGKTLQIGSQTTSVVNAAGQLTNLQERLESLRKVYGDGLIILDAQYGSGNRWGDIREAMQMAIADDVLSVTVGEGWGDPAPGSAKQVKVTYWDGAEIKSVQADGRSKLELRGKRPEAIRSLAPLPRYAVQGQALSHSFGGRGTFAMVEGPKGATLSPTGVLTWTPASEQVGVQQFRVTLGVGGKTYTYVARIEIVSPETAKMAHAGPAQLDAAMRLELVAGGCAYVPGRAWKTGLVLQGSELIVVNADGITVRQRTKLAKTYTCIAEREGYYVALGGEPKALDLLDKSTLKPMKSIKLPYHALTDLALHPTDQTSYVAVEEAADEGPRYRVIVVDEASGEVREPKNVVGRYLAADPTGRRLYTGYKDIYQKGAELFMNPDGGIWETPKYGDIDILMVYDLSNPAKPQLKAYKEAAGANGSGIRLSPDGKRLTYLSHVGYPLYSGAIPAWDPSDLEKKPVTYECKGKAGATKMTYHPSLPLVAVPGDHGPLFFNRETGDEEKDRVTLAPGTLDNTRVNEVYFSPDGANAILECQRGGTWWLYKVPLVVSAQEKEKLRRGVLPAEPPKAPPPPLPAHGGQQT